jgi:hypothetical protein
LYIVRLPHHATLTMDTVERGAIENEKERERRDGDVELGRENGSEPSATGETAFCMLWIIVFQIG